MNLVPATILADYYKVSHREQYPVGTEVVYSTWIPRFTYMPAVEEVTFFGLQAFIQHWLIDYFDEVFFNRPVEEVTEEYARIIRNTLGIAEPDVSHLEALHDLGYLPLLIKAVPEGTSWPLRTPLMTIENTHPEMFWLTNYLETLMSAQIWQPSTSATIARAFRRLLDDYAERTGGDPDFVGFQGHDFSYRGMGGTEAAMASGGGHLLSFVGTDTIPAIAFLEDYYGADVTKELVGTSIPACYDDQTEVLTQHGFKRFADLDEGELIAQYHDDGTVDFVVPTAYFDEPYTGDMVTFEHAPDVFPVVDLAVTPNHRMVRRHVRTDQLGFFDAATEADFGYSTNWTLPVAGRGVGDIEEFTMMDRLRLAFQADGSFSSRSSSYTGRDSGRFPVRFSLKKERKKERLRWILDSLEAEYTWSEYANGYCSVRVSLDRPLSKTFDWLDLSTVSSGWAKGFLDELPHWDGSRRSDTLSFFTSTDCFAVEQVQALAVLAGYKSHLAWYEDGRSDSDRKRSWTVSLAPAESIHTGKVKRGSQVYNGRVYCVSVPTKMLVVRRNGCVAVSGNTEHSVMCAHGGDELTSYRYLLSEVYPKGFVSVVSDTWDLWAVITQVLPQLKEAILARDGRLVIRPDSGDPVDIICGDPAAAQDSPAYRGVIDLLWDCFGGTKTAKGYKLLDSHIGCIYGDAITYERCRAICDRLEVKGFASTNMVYGIGSFSYQYQTRDTFGFALKSTYTKRNGNEVFIYKDPVTDVKGGKKSLTGKVAVVRHPDRVEVLDGLTEAEEASVIDNVLQPVFRNGTPLRIQNLAEIRERAHAR